MKIKNRQFLRNSRPALLTGTALIIMLTLFNQGFSSSPFQMVPDFFEPQEQSIVKGDKEAEFPGGHEAFMKYVAKRVKYPEAAKKDKIEGTVYIEFTIDRNGYTRDFKVLRGVAPQVDEAALVALEDMPKWKPAEKDGKKVASKMTLPIKFALSPEAPDAPAAPNAPKAPQAPNAPATPQPDKN